MSGFERGDSNLAGASMLRINPIPIARRKVKMKNPMTVVHIISPIRGVQSTLRAKNIFSSAVSSDGWSCTGPKEIAFLFASVRVTLVQVKLRHS